MGEEFKTLEIVQKSPNLPIFHLFLNRPSHLNALSLDFFSEFPKALSLLDQNPSVRVVVLSGRGRHFCSGIDVSALRGIADSSSSGDPGRIRERLRRQIKGMQAAITALEQCRKPVIAEIHGACIGGAIDIVTACDIRYCTEATFFEVKEVDLGLAADLGTLQRLPRIVGFGNAMELTMTGRRFGGTEAKNLGLVSRVFKSKQEMEEGVSAIAQAIAEKSPLAVSGTKEVLVRSRDLSIHQGLDYVATWNSAMLLSDDLEEAVSAHMQKRKPKFSKL
ncbi:hypothetical protein AAC387_Pa02g3878 [Persea americana]